MTWNSVERAGRTRVSLSASVAMAVASWGAAAKLYAATGALYRLDSPASLIRGRSGMKSSWSRRAVLRGGAAVGAITALPPRVLAQAARNAPYVNLTPAEAATLEAVVARLIPADANGPGALEAGAARYIDGALGSALAAQR